MAAKITIPDFEAAWSRKLDEQAEELKARIQAARDMGMDPRGREITSIQYSLQKINDLRDKGL